MRRFVFPLLVLAVAAALWLLERLDAPAGGPGRPVETAVAPPAAPRPAAGPAEGEARSLLTPVASAPAPELPAADGRFALLLRFRATPPAALRGAVCRLDHDGPLEAAVALDGALDERGEVRFRVPSGRARPALLLGDDRLELAEFEMPPRDHVETIDLGALRPLRLLVLAGGAPVHPARVEVWGYDAGGEARRRVEGATSTAGAWNSALLFGGADHVRVIPEQPWLRQSFGPFPLAGLPEEWTLELPVAQLEIVAQGEIPAGLTLRRLPLLAAAIADVPPEDIPLRPLLADGLARATTGPCVLDLRWNPGALHELVGECRIEAGRHYRVELRALPAGELHFELRGPDREVLPAGFALVHESGTNAVDELPLYERDGVAFAGRWRLRAGRWYVEVRAPLLLAGSEPPAYWLAQERTWTAEVEVPAGGVQTLAFVWDGVDSFVPRLGGGD